MDRQGIHQTSIPQKDINLWETNVPAVTNHFCHESDAHATIKPKDPSFPNPKNNLNILWSGCGNFTNRIRQQSWMQPFITLAPVFPFTGVSASWIASTLSQANEKDTSSKLIMIGQLFRWGLSKINNHFLDSRWQPMLGLVTPRKTLWRCHSTFLTHLNLACCCGVWLLQLDGQSW